MIGKYDIKSGVLGKVAFLGLFVAALLSARLIVAVRDAIRLSEPVELAYSGLSVPMPEGNGWRCNKEWKSRQGTFTLVSAFGPGSSRPSAWARCTYVFPAEIIDIEKLFERQAFLLEGRIINTGRIQNDPINIEWAHIRKSDEWSNTFFGIAELPHHRRVEIEVQESTGDADLAGRTFRSIAANLRAAESPLLETGRELITKMKDKGLPSFLDNGNRQSLFLIKDSRGQVIGFTTDVIVDNGNSSGSNIQAGGLSYTRGRLVREQVTSFQSDNQCKTFTWKSESVGDKRSGVSMVLDDSGILTVTTSDPQAEEMSYRIGGTAIPEILLEQLLSLMVESDKKESVVDVIGSNGAIVPTHISEIEIENVSEEKDVSHTIKLMPLKGRASFQLVSLDDRGRILKSIVKSEGYFTFKSAEPEDVARIFPERAEFILQSDKLKKYLDEMI